MLIFIFFFDIFSRWFLNFDPIIVFPLVFLSHCYEVEEAAYYR